MFEDPKQSSSDVAATALSTQEWLDTLDRAKEIAMSQHGNNTYPGDEGIRDMSSGLSSHANTIDQTSDFPADNSGATKATLVKHQAAAEPDPVKGKKRFSRRHSKNGLSAVF